MKRLFFLAAFTAFFALSGVAQKTTTTSSDVNNKSWLKIGIEPSIPVGDLNKGSSFALGGVLAAQWLVNPHFGAGVATGYTHYFPKNGGDGFGTVPLALLLRYYPHPSGLFVGGDVGYGFLTNVTGENGGFYFKPEVGYHNYNWNFYAFYSEVSLSNNYPNISSVGVGAIYNLRFRK